MTTLDFSKPDQLQTRDGRAVRIYATDVGCIHGAVFSNGRWSMREWQSNGKFTNSKNDDLCDLVTKPARITGWLNVYDGHVGTLFTSKEEAVHDAGGSCRGQIYIDSEVQE